MRPTPDGGPRALAIETSDAQRKWTGIRLRFLKVAVGMVVLWVVAAKVSPLLTPAKWDEFIYVYDAQRILDGQVPYRDFFQFTPPGDILVLAGWFGLTAGKASLTLGRYLAAGTVLATWALLICLLRRAGWGGMRALALASLYPVTLYTFWAIPTHHWFANLVLVAGFLGYGPPARRMRGGLGWLWTGACTALAFLFLQTAGVVMVALWGTFWIMQRERRKSSAAMAAAGAAGILVPWVAWLWASGSMRRFYEDVFVWTAGHYRSEGGVNAVGLLADLPDRMASLWHVGGGSALTVAFAMAGTAAFAGVVALAMLVGAAWGAAATRAARQRRLGDPFVAGALCATVVEACLFLMGKPDWLHLVYALGRIGPIWLLLGPSRGLGPGKTRRWVWALVGALLAVSAFFHAGSSLVRPVRAWEFTDVDRPTREAPVNRWLRAQPWLLPGDTVAAFPEGGEVYLYVRPAGVGYTLLYPPADRYHSAADYAVVARQLDVRKPQCILITTDRERDYLTPATPLSERLARDYVRLGTVGDAAVYRRRAGP